MKAVDGTALRLKRKDAGLSVKDLADRIGCDATTVTKIELGQRDPSVELLGRLAAAVGCLADELMRSSS